MRFLTVLAVMIIGLMAYVRLAPTDTAKWHQMPQVSGPGDFAEEGSFRAVRKIAVPAVEVLTAFEQRALATPRTTLVSGSGAEGMLTFRTRSQFWGFPDYTTVAVQGELLIVYGRLRFGRSDLGVNKARIEGWLVSLGPLTEAL